MPTSRRLVQFSEGKSLPERGTIVYIDGTFDMFHMGHVEILKVGEDGKGWQGGRVGRRGEERGRWGGRGEGWG